MTDDRLLEYWRAEKLKRFRPYDEFGHDAYERWWLDHHGAGESYTYARHVEAHLKRARRLKFLRRFDNLFAVHDYFLGRYGPLIGAEGFRRALWTLAMTDQQQRLLQRHRAARAARGRRVSVTSGRGGRGVVLCSMAIPIRPPGKPAPKPQVYEKPTPKVKRLKKGKVFTAAERAAFLAGRPDLKKPD